MHLAASLPDMTVIVGRNAVVQLANHCAIALQMGVSSINMFFMLLEDNDLVSGAFNKRLIAIKKNSPGR
jgi:hypothetical protein